MSLAFEITLRSDTASPALERAAAFLTPARIQAIVGTSGADTVQRHLYKLNTERPNRLGGTRTNFYTRAGDSTTWRQASEDTVLIAIALPGIAQRYYGGTIKPTGGRKYLTIPARAEAHGRTAGSFKDLVIVFGQGGKPIALARAGQTTIGFRRQKETGFRRAYSKGAAGGEIMYWLKTEITQQPDPTVLPTEEEVIDVITTDVTEQFNREVLQSSQ